MSSAAASYLVWALLGVAVVVVLALSLTGRVARLSPVVARVLSKLPARLALLLGWMWLGWHFFAR